MQPNEKVEETSLNVFNDSNISLMTDLVAFCDCNRSCNTRKNPRLDNIDNIDVEEEALMPVMRPIRRTNAFEVYNDKQFYTQCRIKKAAVHHLIDLIGHNLTKSTRCHNVISAETQKGRLESRVVQENTDLENHLSQLLELHHCNLLGYAPSLLTLTPPSESFDYSLFKIEDNAMQEQNY
uniref:Uncharacterized protein n=1 Tax=Romanomermis culicivorax TaxID=13658 RepID=A0A915KXR4_ROMCU